MTTHHHVTQSLDMGATSHKEEHPNWVYSASWIAGRERIVSAGRPSPRLIPGRGVIRAWDAFSGGNPTTYGEQRYRVNSVACSPDGLSIASAGQDKTVRIHTIDGATQVGYSRKHKRPVRVVAWSPDGQYLASGGDDGNVYVWEVEKVKDSSSGEQNVISKLKGEFRNHKAGINALAWSPDGSLIASAGKDKTVRIWTLKPIQEKQLYKQHLHRVNAVAWSGDGRWIASAGGDKQVRIWEAASGDDVQVIESGESSARKLLNRLLAIKRLIFQRHRKHQAVGSARPRPPVLDIITALAWSPSPDADNQKLAVASGSVVHIYKRTQNGVDPMPFYTYREHTSWVRALSWSADGNMLASAGDDKMVRVWNITPSHRVPSRTLSIPGI